MTRPESVVKIIASGFNSVVVLSSKTFFQRVKLQINLSFVMAANVLGFFS